MEKAAIGHVDGCELASHVAVALVLFLSQG